MKLLFVRSNQIGSKIIRWTLRERASHFAICFDEEAHGSGIAFESAVFGTRLVWFQEFRKTHHIVYALSFKAHLPLQDEEDIYLSTLEQYSGQGYDYGALLFWMWRGLILWRIFGIPIPVKNLWAQKGFQLCTGLAGALKWIRCWAEEKSIDLEMISPEQLYMHLLQTGYFNDEREWVEIQNST